MRRATLLLAVLPLALAACAGALKPKDAAAGAVRPEVSQPMRRPPAAETAASAAKKAAAAALPEPLLPAAAIRVTEKAAADKAAEDKTAADKLAVDKAAAEKTAAEKEAADKKATADKAVTDKAAAEKKAAADKAAADKMAAADKAAKAKAAKAEPAPAAPGTPSIKSSPASQALVVDPAAERGPAISRNVSAVEGSRFELPFEGTGWTYLGDRDGKDGILYGSRRFEGAAVVFALNAAKAGDYLLRFQKQDALRGLSYEELIGVTVSPRDKAAAPTSAAAKTSSVSATVVPATVVPATVVPATSSAAKTATAQTPGAASTATAASSAGDAAKSATIPDTPDGMLLYAREELAAGHPQGAIDALDRYLARYPAGMDEVFYLYGTALEQSGPLKDIKRAYSYYKMVRDDYPESGFWDRANARIGYIERHYFEIR
jgi:hypothetical protein